MRYKEISIATENDFSWKHKKIMDSFFADLKDNIYYEYDENSIKIFVHNLDFSRFQSKAIELKTREENDVVVNLIDQCVNAVGSVKSYGLKSGKRVYVDYNSERKVKDRKLKEGKRKSLHKSTTNKNIIQDNELPVAYENKIICGDSLEVLKNLPDNCVDVMITSPPYNFGLEYETGEDDKKWEEYFDTLFAIFKETTRVLKYGGRMIINIQPLFSDYIPTHHIISKYLLDLGMLWKGEIIWEKNNYNCKYTAWGSWKSPSSPYLKYTWEFLEVFCKGSLKHAGDKENIDISEEEFKKWVVAKWSVAPERNMKQFRHPAMFPEKLVERCIKLFSFKNDVVLDVFNGVGTTSYVAKEFGRRYVGIDISEEYCRVAESRIQNKLF